MSWNDVRLRTAMFHGRVDETVGTRVLMSAGFAGFLMFMGILSFPLPWTPVPFSMMPLGLLLVGAYQRPGYAALSVVIYLVAAGVGLPVFAEGESGWHHLVGATAGYLFGFVVVSSLVSAYMQRRRALLPMGWVAAIGAAVGVLVIGGIIAIIRFQSTGGLAGIDPDLPQWGVGRSVLWVLVFLTAIAAVLTIWSLQRARGQGLQALNLFLVMLASIGVLHIMGVAGLIFIAALPPITAIIVGSIVFLPFDIVKAGLAVAASLPFLPAPDSQTSTKEFHA